MQPRRAVSLLVLLPALWSCGPARAGEADHRVELFEKKVRPVLAQHCYPCHSAGAKKLRGGLRLDSRAGLLKGGDRGPALAPGEPEKSRLVEAVGYQSTELQMPPRGKLPDAVIADLAAWVRMGAPWPEEKSTTAATTRGGFDLERRKREHWAWQPIRPQGPPAVKDAGWPRDPADRFILAKLEEKGLTPTPAADRRTLLRRLSFDLVGLPPTPAEIDAFVHDESADAPEKVVDRLLASPHFGERWARHWLDLVRYAETRGHEFDYPAPNAHQYRDYVVRALNADLPYDQFVTEHIAGDLLPRPRRHPQEGFNESILATGFWFLGEEVHSPVDIRQDQADRFDNKVDVLSKAFLGLTVACARCHDHKFDAISTKDYYALYGFLQSSSYRLARFDSREHNRRVAAELWRLREQGRAPLQSALAEALRPGAERLADYLLAAREAVLPRPEAFDSAYRQRLQGIALAHKLDAAVLTQWAAHLLAAARDEQDPLHLWARVATNPGASDPKRLAELVPPVVEAWRRRSEAASSSLKGTEVIIDYGRGTSDGWLPDGVAFGPGPVRPGEVRVGGDPARPNLHFIEQGAAEKDPAWDSLKLAAGTENEPGALGGAVRAGRTIRTPTFGLTTGKVFYLVKGTGLAYAAVGSHVLIAGPLHGQLVRKVKAGDRFQWVAHDLSAYRGLRAHLEFTATGRDDFAVACVVQAADVPGPNDGLNRLLLRAFSNAGGSVEALAAAYQQVFLDTVGKLEADRVLGSPEAADHARLSNWLVRHPALLGATGPALGRLAEEPRAFAARQAEITARIRRESRLAMTLMDGSAENEYVFIRGSHKAAGEVVPRRFLAALAGPQPLAVARGSGRLELARQMTDPALDPFLPRVLVNRVWHHLFGRGIVASTDNFGVLGERPTHPELLDHLADRFIRDGWSIKRLIRALVLSNTYRMSSQPNAIANKEDPINLLLHRMRMRRLEGEAIRDAMLAVSGQLNDRLYGPPVPVYLTAFQDGRGRPASGPLDGDGRRSLYLSVRRNFLSPFLLAFDTPSPFSTVGRRTVSNVPAQSLILLNDPFVHQQARAWADRVLARPGSARERITAMYEGAFARPPTEAELTACRDFLRHKPEAQARETDKPDAPARGPDDPAAWADLAHVLFNVKEFIFVN